MGDYYYYYLVTYFNSPMNVCWNTYIFDARLTTIWPQHQFSLTLPSLHASTRLTIIKLEIVLPRPHPQRMTKIPQQVYIIDY